MSYQASKSPLLKYWQKYGRTVLGRWFVTKMVCFTAPYFSSIKPSLKQVRAGRVEVFFKKRRSVQNHIQTVHAIAMCNAAELAGGLCMDISLDRRFRWIPVGMTVRYQKMAKTDLRAICEVVDFHWNSPQDVVMPVSVLDTNDEEVFRADITMRVSANKPR